MDITYAEVKQPRLLLTMEEAAESLGICRAYLYRLVTEKQIATVKLGRARRIPLTELQAFIEQNLDR
jgi:excisionase family DNA binding protein